MSELTREIFEEEAERDRAARVAANPNPNPHPHPTPTPTPTPTPNPNQVMADAFIKEMEAYDGEMEAKYKEAVSEG